MVARSEASRGPAALLIGSSLYWVGLLISTVVMGVLLVLTAPLPFPARQRFSVLWPRFNMWWLKLTCGLRYQVEGMDNMPAGAAVYLCKHQSAWETIAMETIVPRMVWVLKRELMWVPVFGWALAVLKPIAINRAQNRAALDQLLEQGADRLKQGINVVIFPEGTRVAPGEKTKYHGGGAILAVKAGYPVVPMAHNAGYYWPKRGFVKRPGTIRFVVGPAIQTAGRSASQVSREAEQWIETTVAELGGPDRG